jgi:alpha-beta hydrolase superfamily lysophospholipase
MKTEEGYFTNKRGQVIFHQSWLPEGDSKGIVLIIHGLNEHSSRYAHLAGFLVEEGFSVYSLDHNGHGKSEGTRSYTDKFSDFTDDLIIFLEMIRNRERDKTLFILGHSMGALIGTLLLMDERTGIDGAVLSGSLIQVPEYINKITIWLGKKLAILTPKLGLTEIDKEGLSQDPQIVQAYLDDPLVHSGKVTVRLSSEINSAMSIFDQDATLIHQPVLLLHGGSDPIVDPADSKFLLDKISSSQKQLIIYDGFYHEIYNEPGKNQVYRDVADWLNSQLS